MKSVLLSVMNIHLVLRVWGVSLLFMSSHAFGNSPVVLPYSAGAFVIDPATMEVSLRRGDGRESKLSAAAFNTNTRVSKRSGNEWRIQHGREQFRIHASIDQDALLLSIRADQPVRLNWPRPVDAKAIKAHAIPFGEGSFIPGDDPQWQDWLLRRYQSDALNAVLTMPFWTELRDDYSITWIVETPFDTFFGVREQEGRALPELAHDFNRLAPDAPYIVRIVAGPEDPLFGARLFRKWLQDRNRFVSLNQKIEEQPQVAKLAGAAHIYLWDAGPLKVRDVLRWPEFLRLFAQRRDDPGHLASRLWETFDQYARDSFNTALEEADGKVGQVPLWYRLELIRTINSGLQKAVIKVPINPLPGNHDPAAEVVWGQSVRTELVNAFGDLLAPAERWGGGLSLDTISALQQAGLSRAWLGADDWRDAFWHPEAVAAAKAAGYLVAVYDSYGSAHPSSLLETWSTAQMGDELAAAGYMDAEGVKVRGFNNRGVYVNASIVEPYAQQRIKAVVEAAQLNSYFLDVDAAGPERNDFTPGRETSMAQDAEALTRRLSYPRKTLDLVTGSEGGLALYAPTIAYSHGIATQPFAWMDPDIGKNKQSPYYRGNYWPPETPSLYFKTVPLKREIARFVTSSQFRLPLYQMVLHDSLVTTHHWEYSSLKFSTERETTALLQLLYMVPALYHLNDLVLERDLPLISAYDKVFRPLHERLFTVAMKDFQVLNENRTLQRSVFADGTSITANFAEQVVRSPEGLSLPPLSASVIIPGQETQVIEVHKVLAATR